MYQPEGSRPGRSGIVTPKLSLPESCVSLRSTERCSTSVTCVTALGRISRALLIAAASGLANWTVVAVPDLRRGRP